MQFLSSATWGQCFTRNGRCWDLWATTSWGDFSFFRPERRTSESVLLLSASWLLFAQRGLKGWKKKETWRRRKKKGGTGGELRRSVRLLVRLLGFTLTCKGTERGRRWGNNSHAGKHYKELCCSLDFERPSGDMGSVWKCRGQIEEVAGTGDTFTHPGSV